MIGAQEILSILEYVIPAIVGLRILVWSLVSSKLAWWISKTFAKTWQKRVSAWFFVWLVVMFVRIILFFKVWRRGVGPVAQYHAWKQFLSLVECFVEERSGTICFTFITLISNSKDEKVKTDDLKIEDIAKKEDGCGLVCYEPLPRFLKTVFASGDAEQRYLTALFSLIKHADENKFWGKLVNDIVDYLHRFDLGKAKKEYIAFAILFANRVADFAVEHKDRELAALAIGLRQRVYVLGKTRSEKRDAICRLIDDIVASVNDICVKVEVIVMFGGESGSSPEVKLITGPDTNRPKMSPSNAV